jgi:hypothetical protein
LEKKKESNFGKKNEKINGKKRGKLEKKWKIAKNKLRGKLQCFLHIL